LIRPVTLFWGASAGVAVAMLFVVSYQVQERERELDRLNRAILGSKAAIHVLHAEWAYLTRPGRLERLSVAHLNLVPIPPERIMRIEDLPMLPVEHPPVASAGPGPGPTADAVGVPSGMRAVGVRASGASAQGFVR